MADATDKVVLLEFPDEAEAYAAQCRRRGLDPAAARVISLHPKVQLWLDRHGVPSVNSLPYFSSDSHARALRKSQELLAWLETGIDLEDGLGIKSAYTNALMWYSRFFIHHLLWLCEILSSVHSQHPGATIMAPLTYPNGHGSPMLQADERYLGSLAKDCCSNRDLAFDPIDTAQIAQPRGPNKDQGVRGLKRLGYKVGARLHRAALRRMGRSRPLLAVSGMYRMEALVRRARRDAPEFPWVVRGESAGALGPLRGTALLRRGLQALTAGTGKNGERPYLGEAWVSLLERSAQEDPSFVASLTSALDGLAQEVEKETELFSHRGILFGRYYAAKVRTGIATAMRRQHLEVRALDETLQLLQPRLVMTPFGRRSYHALGELARRRGIPGLLISHGSFTPVKDDLEEAAWGFHAYGMLHGSYTYAAVQTPLAEAFARQLTPPPDFVRTGPLSWGSAVDRQAAGRLKARMFAGQDHRRVVLHAGSPKTRGSNHFHIYETLDEYISGLKELVEGMDGVPNAFLVIKFRPQQLSEEELRALLPPSDRFCISVDEPFLDVLGFSDLLVSFASTTIEEALQNRVPVLLYGGEGRYQHVEPLEVNPHSHVEPQAVYAVRRPEHLTDALTRILDTNGGAPLPAELFQQYVYKPEEIIPFDELLRSLAGSQS